MKRVLLLCVVALAFPAYASALGPKWLDVLFSSQTGSGPLLEYDAISLGFRGEVILFHRIGLGGGADFFPMQTGTFGWFAGARIYALKSTRMLNARVGVEYASAMDYYYDDRLDERFFLSGLRFPVGILFRFGRFCLSADYLIPYYFPDTQTFAWHNRASDGTITISNLNKERNPFFGVNKTFYYAFRMAFEVNF